MLTADKVTQMISPYDDTHEMAERLYVMAHSAECPKKWSYWIMESRDNLLGMFRVMNILSVHAVHSGKEKESASGS